MGIAQQILKIISKKVPVMAGKSPLKTCLLNSNASRGGVVPKISSRLRVLKPLIIKNPRTLAKAVSKIKVQILANSGRIFSINRHVAVLVLHHTTKQARLKAVSFSFIGNVFTG